MNATWKYYFKSGESQKQIKGDNAPPPKKKNPQLNHQNNSNMGYLLDANKTSIHADKHIYL